SPILRHFEKFLRLKLLNLTIMFYTNYSGIEKQIKIKFLEVKKIDVNDDGKDDIKVKLGLSFSIQKLLHFSINFKNTITRLPDFPDASAHFEAYSELYIPGILFVKRRGDRIRFGYESPEGEEVPSNCQIIYRYLPNIVYLRKKPGHKIEVNPSINNNSKLIMILGFTNYNINKNIVSELNTKVIYNPAVKSSITFSGNGILGGSIFEFTREHVGESQVDMYCSFEKNNKTIISYVKDLQKKVTFTINFGRNGNIKFNTHNQAPTEIGVCNDFYNPDYKIYFTNLPSKAELNWNIRIIKQKINLEFYTDRPGTCLKGEFRFSNNSTSNLTVYSKIKLDCQMSLDLKNGYFVFNRNKVDILFDLSYNKKNTSLYLSTNISSFNEQPFEIFFGKLFDGNADVEFHGSYLEVNDLEFLFTKNTSDQTSEQNEQFLIIEFTSLLFTSRDFIKLTYNDETKEANLSGGGNGSIKLENLIIEGNLFKIPPGYEIQLGLFEIESDHLYGSAANVSFNISDIKNFIVESFALENAISKIIIEEFSIKMNINEYINLTEFKANFSGNGVFQVTKENDKFNVTGAINGPGFFQLDILNIDINLLNLSNKIILQDFLINGPTTFFIYLTSEFNQGKITNVSLVAGVDTQWHIGKFYLKILDIPVFEIINLNGIGRLSGGFEKCQYEDSIDIVISLAGSWDWKKLYFIPLSEEGERPGIQFGSFSGNFTSKIHFPNIKKLGNGHLNFIVHSVIELNQFEIEISKWLISVISIKMQPGNSYISWIDILDLPNLHFLINNSDTINLQFDTFFIENKNTGKNFSFRSREFSVPNLEIMTNINGDGSGFLYLDTDNQYCNFEITKSEFIKINKIFRAKNCNISWDFNQGLFNIIDISGFIEFGKEFEILIFINGKWRILISINQPVAEFTWSPFKPNVNETIQFDASGSHFSAPITRYDWKWYSTDTWHNNLGAYPTHSYNQNGSYKVTLRVWSGLKNSICSKIINVGESKPHVEIIYNSETLFEGTQFSVLVTDLENNNSPLSGVLVTYAQQDFNGNWQNITNITNSDGIASFVSFDVPQYEFVDYSYAKIFVSISDCPDAESQWFKVYSIPVN
ncbi:MAG: PKD domain-containing protein, partial [Candidatus Thermoplasmatota archaeon]|nr:PKD domain-containing protein [Candidatus Thermoplasmatota archaeon]